MNRYGRRRGPGRPRHPDVLTPAEWRVLELVREGLSNGEIATRLDVSVNTVRTHVSRTLAKTGAADRVALAAWDGEPEEASLSALGRLRALSFLAWLRGGAGVPSWVAGAGLVVAIGVLAVVVIAGLAGLRDGDGDGAPSGAASPGGTPAATVPTLDPTRTPTAAPTATARATPVPVRLVDGLPEGSVGPLLVYTHTVGQVPSGSRTFPRFEVAVYDAGRDERVSAFEIGEAGSYAADVQITDREVIVNFEHELVAFALDGSHTRTIYEAPPGDRVIRPAVSNDGSMIAFTREHWHFRYATFYILDLATLDVIAEHGTTLLTGGFGAVPAARWWSEDDELVLLSGITYNDSTAIHGVVTIGGELIAYEPRQLNLFDPTGQYVLHGDRSCMGHVYPEFWVTDLSTGESRLLVEDTGQILTPLEWSPDGSVLLYEARAGDPEDCDALSRAWTGPGETLLVDRVAGIGVPYLRGSTSAASGTAIARLRSSAAARNCWGVCCTWTGSSTSVRSVRSTARASCAPCRPRCSSTARR